MTAAERTMAQFQSLIENLPETVHISLRRTSHIDQVNRDNTLVETSIEFMPAVRQHLGILYRQERTAAHARVNLALL